MSEKHLVDGSTIDYIERNLEVVKRNLNEIKLAIRSTEICIKIIKERNENKKGIKMRKQEKFSKVFESWVLGHGRGHADKKTFELLKKHFESKDCEVTVTKEKNNLVYFKVLSNHPQQKIIEAKKN